ncbi:hypothetical protein BTBSAS_20002 [Brochothrix thermosphacta]|uniref:Gram-positive cocci surface proteins LPxTG domain-containing protein n=1 Tax=Brochothrix thermosphacta TaxID=2756 RepID=A0A2X0S5Y9_BROTH|nr:hypothetical protein BTBSAS_20002 [Brochothrix thermosphacta]
MKTKGSVIDNGGVLPSTGDKQGSLLVLLGILLITVVGYTYRKHN